MLYLIICLPFKKNFVFGGNMEKSLEYFDAYQREYYQQLLIKMGPMSPVLDKIAKFLKESVNDLQFCMRVHIKTLPKILESDTFKQVIDPTADSSATIGGVEARLHANKYLFNLNPDKLNPEDHPKFGYLTNAHNGNELLFNASLSHQYGSVLIVFKKANLIHRTTLTFGSSMNFGASMRLVPTRVDNILPTCIQGLPNKFAKSGVDIGPQLIMRIASLLLTGELSVENVARMGENFGDAPGLEYLELQYHGQLTLSKDVETVYLCPWDDGDDEIIETVQKKLTAMGINNKLVSIW